MSGMNSQGKQAGFRLALISSLLALALLLPATAWASSYTVKVPPPNGADDTANIQAALDACVAQGPGCTLQLAAGTYLTRQLVAYNFQGAFKGMGRDITRIEALPHLYVNFKQEDIEGLCPPDPTSCFWPTVIIFVNGNVHVSDLSVAVTAAPGTATTSWNFGGTPYIGLLDGMTFTGQHVTAAIDRIHMEGRLDPTNAYGYNVVNLLHFTGEFPRSLTPWDWYFVSGSFTVRNSCFNTGFVGISQDGFFKSSQVTIGGSPSSGNRIENGYGGIDLETSENSVFDISYNESSGSNAGMWVVPWFLAVFVPSSSSQYWIHDNKFVGTGGVYNDGMYLSDDPSKPWIEAWVWDNKVEVQAPLMEGIGVYNTKRTAVWNNTVTGTDGFDAIGLWSSALSSVVGNNVSGFTVDPAGYAQIYLDPSTAHDLVVCAEPSDTALNQGTDNVVIGCQQPAATSDAAAKSAAPAASTSKRDVPKRKPWLR